MIDFELISLPGGERAFRKYLRAGASDCFRAEAEGLAALAATSTVSTPQVLRVGDAELVSEYIESGPESAASWRELGRQLARLHNIAQPCFGFSGDNYCGATPQPNPRCDDGHEFFTRHRLDHQGRLARDAALLDADDARQLETITRRLPELVPRQEPALLHGDLWHGNVLFDTMGEARLIDPACYWGWPEAELGMTTLFGAFPAAFYEGYSEEKPLAPGWCERVAVYNLYHLLNHLNLFGRSYYAQVKSVLREFGS